MPNDQPAKCPSCGGPFFGPFLIGSSDLGGLAVIIAVGCSGSAGKLNLRTGTGWRA